ncbi:MAG: hypothetical protein ACNS61_09730 [Candidatus Wenzhouxiangella sp. M2_3B_020]
MSQSQENQRPSGGHRRAIRRTVVVLAVVAAVIYLGFIARGVLG